MNWKELIESLKKENAEAFAAYEADIRSTLQKEFEQKILDEVKKQQVDEKAVREKVLEELKPQLEALEAYEAILENIRALVSDDEGGGDAAGQGAGSQAADPKLKEQAEAAGRQLETEKRKTAELESQLAAERQKLATREKIVVATAGKPYPRLLTERLIAMCTKPEDVDAKMAQAEGEVKSLLTEAGGGGAGSGAGSAAGSGKVADEDKGSGSLTEAQQHQRRLAGVR